MTKKSILESGNTEHLHHHSGDLPNLADRKEEEKKIQMCHTNIFSEILMQKKKKKGKKMNAYTWQERTEHKYIE